MADAKNATPALNLVAIDVGRYWNAVLIESLDGKQRRFKMAATAADFERLLGYLRALPGACRIALEPTGDYHRSLAHRLLSEGMEVVSINSVAQARYREAMFNSWDKNDPKDAAVILEMLRRDAVQRYVDPMIAGYHDLQELAKTYYQVSLARTKVQHSLLNHSLPLYFPEMHRYWVTTRNDWFVSFLLRFPTPVHVRSLTCNQFIDAAWDVVGRKVNKRAKLSEIWETAAATTALPHSVDSLAVETFRINLRRYQELNVLRADLEHRAEAALADNADFAHLKTLPGVGSITAMTILAEAGDLRRFGHHRQFLKYCGFDLAKTQSGMQRGKEQLSKRGHARLRLAFWLAAVVAVHMKENSFRAKYERYIRVAPDDRDLRRKALTAVAAKMARVAYGMVKKNQPYRQFFEQSLPSGSIPLLAAVGALATP